MLPKNTFYETRYYLLCKSILLCLSLTYYETLLKQTEIERERDRILNDSKDTHQNNLSRSKGNFLLIEWLFSLDFKLKTPMQKSANMERDAHGIFC